MTIPSRPNDSEKTAKHRAENRFGLRKALYLLVLIAAVGLAVAPPEDLALGPLIYLPAIVLWIGFVVFFRMYRQWLLYYVVGAFGLTVILIFAARGAGMEATLIQAEISQAVPVANVLGVSAKALSSDQFILRYENGWSILKMGVECSALLELSTLIALILFYPAFTLGWRLRALVIGVAVTYVINLARMLIILGVAENYGPSSIFLGHAVLGRLFFFTLVIALYWFLITWPTVGRIGLTLKERPV